MAIIAVLLAQEVLIFEKFLEKTVGDDANVKIQNSKFKKIYLLPPSKLRENHNERFFVYGNSGRWRSDGGATV